MLNPTKSGWRCVSRILVTMPTGDASRWTFEDDVRFKLDLAKHRCEEHPNGIGPQNRTSAAQLGEGEIK